MGKFAFVVIIEQRSILQLRQTNIIFLEYKAFYSTLNGGKVFSKIDCSNAYVQYRLHVDYRK